MTFATRAQAMILAAGRGERMRPLTDATPKPLLTMRGKPLMVRHMEALVFSGFADQVVNTAWLGEQIPACLDAPGTWSGKQRPRISYSEEGRDFGHALDTAGGIVRALPLLDEVFWVAAGDIFAPGFAYARTAFDAFIDRGTLAHLWLVPNPAHNPAGDFGVSPDGLALDRPHAGDSSFTFSAIGLYRAALFSQPYCAVSAGNPSGQKMALAPVLRAAIKDARVSAEVYREEWHDIGTPQRLAALDNMEDRRAPRA